MADIPLLLTLIKPETQIWGVSNLKFVHTINIYKMVAIFQFFKLADADIPFLLTLRKLETETLGGQ